MTRITERSSAYPGGVRKTRTTNATKFYPFACVAPDTVNSVAPDYYDGDGSIVPIGGSRPPFLLLAYSLKRMRTILLTMGVLLCAFQILMVAVARSEIGRASCRERV